MDSCQPRRVICHLWNGSEKSCVCTCSNHGGRNSCIAERVAWDCWRHQDWQTEQKTTEPELRYEVEKILTPSADQASKVVMKCSKEDWGRIIQQLVPNAHYHGLCDVWKYISICPCSQAFYRASSHSFYFLWSKQVQYPGMQLPYYM